MRVLFAVFSFAFLWISCSKDSYRGSDDTLYTLLDSTETGVNFQNKLDFSAEFNVYKYRNYYNGGGVALGDVNGDSLIDIFLTANSLENKLYLNKGNLKFEDVSETAGIKGRGKWSTGVSMCDLDGDHDLDIYVCNSGGIEGDNRENELFINDGKGKFTEQAAAFGLNDKGFGTHAAFFDYDHDGDLDCYLLNNAFTPIGNFRGKDSNMRTQRDTLGGDKLLRNDGAGKPFADVSDKAGIFGSLIGFGLGVTVGDVNRDGWEDIYISNDFFERDYLYINQKNGTFKEVMTEAMRHCSAASMGADMADINNDAYPDIFATDMLPLDERRLKTKTTFDSWNNYYYEYVKKGYYHQFTRNMLQVNNQDGTFSELACFAGVEATDWSWGALLFDMDLDGYRDLFVANGIYQDLTDQDYIQFISDENTKRMIKTEKGTDYKKLIEAIPSEAIPNHAFRNLSTPQQGGVRFKDLAKDWGLAQPGFSNGSAYGDLDNDGDLDLVINNVNMPTWVYRSNATQQQKDNHWLRFELSGEDANTFALGTSITAICKGAKHFVEQMPYRGFQSTVDPRPHLGLGKSATVDTLIVNWPNGKATVLTNVATNQTLRLHQSEANASAVLPQATAAAKLADDVTQTLQIPFKHVENQFSDFDRERLIYQMRSADGPKMSTADVNGDGKDDLYIGGSKGHAGTLLLQQGNGSFKPPKQPDFEKDAASEDAESVFFDADGDGDKDLFVCSGGSEFVAGNPALADRLYLNDGRGNFTRKADALPTQKDPASSCVAAADFDGDGDIDLFVGMRQIPGVYGKPVSPVIMLNDGKAKFTPASIPALNKLGMVTDVVATDTDGDGDTDIVVCGEYMPVTVLTNEGRGNFSKARPIGLHGWWTCLEAADLNGDGKTDLVAGNYGLNSRFRATDKTPIALFYNDFDNNQQAEPVQCMYAADGNSYPIALRHDLISQMPPLKKRYLKYSSYALQPIEKIFSAQQLTASVKYTAETLATCAYLNDGKGGFSVLNLPDEAQYAPIYAMKIADFNGDKRPDIFLGGNNMHTKPEYGAVDANYGCLLVANANGGYSYLPPRLSGLWLRGLVRDMTIIGPYLLVSRNDDTLQAFRLKG